MISTIPRRAAARLVWLAAPLILFLACCGVYWKLVLSPQYSWVDGPDLVRMEVPRLQFQRAEWQRGAFPLWDPYQWCGQPFLGQVTGAAFPGNWLFSALPFNRQGKIPLGQLHWYFLLIHWLGGLFCYWLCRDLGCSRAASLAGAMTFAFCGFFTVNNWPVMMAGFVWAPLVFRFLLRATQGRRPLASAALCGLFLGLAWLSGHPEVPVYLTLAVGAVWAVAVVRPGEHSRLKMFQLAAVTFSLMLLAGGLQIVPAYEYGLRAVRWAGGPAPVGWKDAIPYTVHAANGWHPSSLPALVIAWFGREDNPYLGVTAVTLAALAVWRRWSEYPVRVFVAVALGGALLAMSQHNVLHGILYAVLPVFGKARHPMRLLSLVDFAAAPLAAYGLDWVLGRLDATPLRRAGVALAVFGGGIFLVLGGSRVFGLEPKGDFTAFSALVALMLAGLLALWRRAALERACFVSLLLLLLVMDLGVVASSFPERAAGNTATWLPNFTKYADIVEYLKQQPQPLRVLWSGETADINLGDWDGIESFGGFGASATANLVQLDLADPRQQDLLALSYTVAKAPLRADAVEVFRGSSGYRVYRNPHAFPRTWTVDDVFRAGGPAEVVEWMRDHPAFDPRRRGVMTAQPPALEQCGAGAGGGGEDAEQSRIAGRTASAVTLEVRMRCRGIVVLADTWFPGWQASVDGHPAAVLEMYGALRGVVVDAGQHRVEMRYRPATAWWGGLMTLAGLVVAGLLAWLSSRPVADASRRRP